MERYLAVSGTMDRAAVAQSMIPRGWLMVGLLAMAYPFIYGNSTPAALAIGIGGTLLGFRALQKLVSSLSSLLNAAIAWRQVAHLFQAAARVDKSGAPELATRFSTSSSSSSALIQAHDLSFRYRETGDPVLHGCDLQIREGDRLLLEGASGGGKSTFAALLSGLRVPASGLLLLRGLDTQTLGTRQWRQRVAAAPQFHENYVLTGTFAFNLLMGRAWPPSPEDLVEAEAICKELGLSDLLERMPSGLQQMVGETGWQLSHGERSRMFLARALLQRSEMVILDESFGALDPETLRQCLRCTLDRASTLLVIAHP
jgi:ATP-binding cassette subfamily B protein